MPSRRGSSASRRPAPAVRRRSTASPDRGPARRARRDSGGRACRSSRRRSRASPSGAARSRPPSASARSSSSIREFVRRARAVEQPDVAVRQVQRVAQHRAQRRDAGAAGDEDEAALVRRRRKGERAERTVDVDELPGSSVRCGAGRAVGVDADQQLEPAVAPRVLGRGGDRVRPPLLVAVRRDRDRLARRVVEGAGRRGRAARCARAASRRSTSRMGSVSTADYAISRMALRRARGMILLRLVRRRGARDDRRPRARRCRPHGSNSAAATARGGWKGWRWCRRHGAGDFLDGADRASPDWVDDDEKLEARIAGS